MPATVATTANAISEPTRQRERHPDAAHRERHSAPSSTPIAIPVTAPSWAVTMPSWRTMRRV